MSGVVAALLCALVWGTADFSGGYASRRAHQYQVVTLSAFSGCILLVACALLAREPLPDTETMLWSLAAGTSGAFGLALLYRGLAAGDAAVVAPSAAVMTAVMPVLVSISRIGLPKPVQLAGFVLAMVGVWLVSRSSVDDRPIHPRKGLQMGLLAGCGFGGFLVLIARAPTTAVFVPVAVARLAMVAVGVGLMLSGGVPFISPMSNLIAHVAGLLDASGNVFYMVAKQRARLDVAGVLASLYPVATVILARVVTKDRIAAAQWIGVALCVVAVALIAL